MNYHSSIVEFFCNSTRMVGHSIITDSSHSIVSNSDLSDCMVASVASLHDGLNWTQDDSQIDEAKHKHKIKMVCEERCNLQVSRYRPAGRLTESVRSPTNTGLRVSNWVLVRGTWILSMYHNRAPGKQISFSANVEVSGAAQSRPAKFPEQKNAIIFSRKLSWKMEKILDITHWILRKLHTYRTN